MLRSHRISRLFQQVEWSIQVLDVLCFLLLFANGGFGLLWFNFTMFVLAPFFIFCVFIVYFHLYPRSEKNTFRLNVEASSTVGHHEYVLF